MNCGAELLARAVFCTSCGKAVGAAPEKPPAEPVMTGLASYGDRVAAWLIDSVIVYGVAIVVLAIIIAVYLPDTADSEPGQTGLGFVLVPGPGAPIGSSPDFTSGPIIPRSVQPITAGGDGAPEARR